MAGTASRSALLASLERDAVHVEDVRKALADLLRRCRREGVSPLADAFVPSPDGVRYATLEALLAFKIASGIWGRRPRDLADAQELIKVNGLAETDADRLPEELRPRFLDLVAASRLERDIE